jgi:CDP-4-dehydro-6-deoxyglucose reductase, E3
MVWCSKLRMDLFHAEVTRIKDLTHDVRELDLQLIEPHEIQFKAGQFVSFEVPSSGRLPFLTRPYSIASPPHLSDRITLVLNLVAGGPGSTYLFGLREGDKTQFKGPAGSFYLREDGRDLLLVATGTGIAPLRSMVLAELARDSARRVTLIWGLRSQRDLYYQEECLELSRLHPRFSVVTTLSRPEPGWNGTVGRVTTFVDREIASVKNISVYLCGNGGMIKEVTAILNGKGLCPIYREKYYEE